METKSEFYTLKGYELNNNFLITPSMEDYLEMICRMLKTEEVVRINLLAEKLNVRPSSASKMTANLRMAGLVTFEKYGYIKPTPKGFDLGNYLLHRHNVLNELLCLINKSDSELEQVEKIEHFFNKSTIDNISNFICTVKQSLENLK